MDPTSLTDPTQHLYWITSRALGIVAILLLSISVGFGLALSGRMGSAAGSSARLKTLHEATSLAALAMIAMHGLVLLGDPYLAPGLKGIALPFTLTDQPIWTGVGIVGGWITAIITASFYVRRWIGVAVWRWLHRWTLLAFALSLGHTLGSGTDAGEAWLVAMLALVIVPVALIGARRAWSAGEKRKPPPTRRPKAVES